MTGAKLFTLQTVIVQDSGNVASEMDGEKVLLNIDKGKYYNLGSIGGRVWELAEEPVAAGAIADILMQEYDVERSHCESQVLSFVEHLYKEGLIRTGE